jgi:transketolase
LPILPPGGSVSRGAYVAPTRQDGAPDVILIASGSEVSLALEAQKKLAEHAPRVRARVVSMPSWELFDAQPQDYRDQVLPPQVKARLAIEAGVPMGKYKYAGDVLAIEHYASAPFKIILKNMVSQSRIS